VYSTLIEVVTFDVFPTDSWYPVWLNLRANDPFSKKFEIFGYDSTTWVLSVGSMWFLGVILAIKFPVFYLVKGSRFWLCRKLEASLS
jgi:hypothetical protein